MNMLPNAFYLTIKENLKQTNYEIYCAPMHSYKFF